MSFRSRVLADPIVALLVASLAWLCVGAGQPLDPLSLDGERIDAIDMPVEGELDGDGGSGDPVGGWPLVPAVLVPEPGEGPFDGRPTEADACTGRRADLERSGRGPPRR